MARSWFTVVAKEGDAPVELSIHDEIGAWGVTARDFIAAFRAVATKGRSVKVSINSPGGSVFDALAIYNSLRQHDGAVECVVMGIAASAASVILMAGDKRVAPENAFVMVHNALSGVYGNADDMREVADILDKISNSIAGIYIARTGKSEEDVKALLANDTYLTAAEALEAGFITEVIPEMLAEASFETDRLPENVRAVFEAKKPAVEPPLPEPVAETRVKQITDAAKAAGFERFVDTWVLDVTLDVAALPAVLAAAREIVDLCAAAKSTEADALITARKTPAEVCAHLTNQRAARDEKNHTDGTPKPDNTAASSTGPRPVTTAGIWASRHKQLQQQRS